MLRRMSFVFEARAYGPDSTPVEVQAIRDCIFMYEPGILYWRELPVQSDFHLQIFRERLTELAAGTRPHLLIDLLVATPPGAEARAALRKMFTSQPLIDRIAVFTGRNFMLNVAAKFVMTTAGLKNFAVHRTLEEALEDLRNATARR